MKTTGGGRTTRKVFESEVVESEYQKRVDRPQVEQKEKRQREQGTSD